MATNVDKSAVTMSMLTKNSGSLYGTATYGEYFYFYGAVPTNQTKSSVTLTMQAKS